jgi:hypothetical protein
MKPHGDNGGLHLPAPDYGNWVPKRMIYIPVAVRKALQVLKKNGAFVFQDEFHVRRIYGDLEQLIAAIKSWGVSNVNLVETRHSKSTPRLLKVPFILGKSPWSKGGNKSSSQHKGLKVSRFG